MNCEFSDGTTWTVTDVGALETRLSNLGSGDHVILSDGDLFIQMARDGATVVLQYGDGRMLYECSDSPSLADAVPIFVSFYQRDDRWRTMASWDGGSSVGGTSGSSGGDRSTTSDAGRDPSRQKGFAEQLVDDAAGILKRKAQNAVRRGLRRFLG